ncbi:MAG: hypothetical protein HQ518_30360 [Rhodopirellula sp.]|nr:hypothetical protein [Rhodopirellula sp.]
MLLTVILIGCSADIDKEQLVKDYTAVNAHFARLCRRCPELKTTVFRIPKMMSFTKGIGIRGTGVLSADYTVSYSAELNFDENGTVSGSPSGAAYSVRNSSGVVVGLSGDEFDRLLEAEDIDAALAETSVTFDLPTLDEKQTLALLRQEIPRLEQLHEKFPDPYARFWALKPYRRDGEIIISASLGTEFKVGARWDFKMDPQGTTVEWNSQGRFDLSETKMRIDSAVNHSTSLTREEFDSILESASPEIVTQKIWSQHPHSDAPFENEGNQND